MSDTGETRVVSGTYHDLGMAMILKLHVSDFRMCGVYGGGKPDALSGVKVLSVDLPPCSGLDRTRNTASQ